jgi:hypothetical protein
LFVKKKVSSFDHWWWNDWSDLWLWTLAAVYVCLDQVMSYPNLYSCFRNVRMKRTFSKPIAAQELLPNTTIKNWKKIHHVILMWRKALQYPLLLCYHHPLGSRNLP